MLNSGQILMTEPPRWGIGVICPGVYGDCQVYTSDLNKEDGFKCHIARS